MASAHLPESDSELREFLDDATVGLRVVSPEGRILWANRAELEMAGYSEQEYIGHHLDEFLVEPGVAADLLSRLARTERIESIQARIRRKDGSIRQVLIDASSLYRDGGARPQPHRDPRHHRFPGEGAGRAAWGGGDEPSEGRVPGASLPRAALATGSDPRVARSPPAGRARFSESERALGIIERSARTLERIIEDLLHASRIAAGGLMLIPQLVDLRGVVQVAVDAASGDAALKGLGSHVVTGRARSG